MTSSGPCTESMNFRHMFEKHDLRGPLPLKVDTPGSLSFAISNHPDFTIFRYILRLSKLDSLYNDPQANFTVFIPSDQALKGLFSDSVFTNMDLATARHIVQGSTLNRKISGDVLGDSPASYMLTQDPPNRLFVTNISGRTYINNHINVIHKDMILDNGIIHVIDNMIYPLII